MNSFSFAPQQHTQSRTQKNYIFVDEHNRHKRPKVSRACENCRKRRTKCDTAKTDTWPCSQCIKLQIDCVLPNGSDSKTTGTTPMNPSDEYQQTSMQQQQISNLGPVTGYATRPAYPDAGGAPCRAVPYESSQQPGSISYGAVPPPASMMEQPYANQNRTSHANDTAAGSSATSLAGSILPGGGSAPGYAPCPTSLSYTSHPITPTISAGPVDRKSGSPVVQSPVSMSQGTQAPGMLQRMPCTDQPEWNPSRIFEQWNTTFGTPTHSHTTTTPSQTSPLNSSSSDAMEVPATQDIHTVQTSVPTDLQQLSLPQYSTAHVPNCVTPSMWQEFVASVYEGGINKRPWDYDGPVLKLH